jgi:hypothetical protein
MSAGPGRGGVRSSLIPRLDVQPNKVKKASYYFCVGLKNRKLDRTECMCIYGSCGVNVIAKPRWSAVVFCASRRRAAASRSSVKLARSAALGDGRTLANREKLRMHADAATCGCGHLFRPGVKSKHARSGGCRRRLIANHMPRPRPESEEVDLGGEGPTPTPSLARVRIGPVGRRPPGGRAIMHAKR